MKQKQIFNDVLPEFEEFKKLSDQLLKESPRAMAIVSCAYLDNVLNEILKVFLIEDKKLFEDFIDRLTFERRIIMCYLLGIIDRQAKDDLKTINKIRGWFAHNIDLNSFSAEIVANECDKIMCLKKVQHKDTITDDPRVKYGGAVSYYLGRLQAMRNLCKRIDIRKLFVTP